jgi:hypothetical protein
MINHFKIIFSCSHRTAKFNKPFYDFPEPPILTKKCSFHILPEYNNSEELQRIYSQYFSYFLKCSYSRQKGFLSFSVNFLPEQSTDIARRSTYFTYVPYLTGSSTYFSPVFFFLPIENAPVQVCFSALPT